MGQVTSSDLISKIDTPLHPTRTQGEKNQRDDRSFSSTPIGYNVETALPTCSVGNNQKLPSNTSYLLSPSPSSDSSLSLSESNSFPFHPLSGSSSPTLACSPTPRSSSGLNNRCKFLRRKIKLRADPFITLPDEIIFSILERLPAVDVCRASQVSRGWRRYCSHNHLWKSIWQREFQSFPLISYEIHPISWKQQYRECSRSVPNEMHVIDVHIKRSARISLYSPEPRFESPSPPKKKAPEILFVHSCDRPPTRFIQFHTFVQRRNPNPIDSIEAYPLFFNSKSRKEKIKVPDYSFSDLHSSQALDSVALGSRSNEEVVSLESSSKDDIVFIEALISDACAKQRSVKLTTSIPIAALRVKPKFKYNAANQLRMIGVDEELQNANITEYTSAFLPLKRSAWIPLFDLHSGRIRGQVEVEVTLSKAADHDTWWSNIFDEFAESSDLWNSSFDQPGTSPSSSFSSYAIDEIYPLPLLPSSLERIEEQQATDKTSSSWFSGISQWVGSSWLTSRGSSSPEISPISLQQQLDPAILRSQEAHLNFEAGQDRYEENSDQENLSDDPTSDDGESLLFNHPEIWRQ